MFVIMEHSSDWGYDEEADCSVEFDMDRPVGYTASIEVAKEYVARDPIRFEFVEVKEVM